MNEYFNKTGAVYDKKDGVHVLMIRNLNHLNSTIIPFFIKYPLVGTKSYEFEKFNNLVKLILSKKHIGHESHNRDIFIKMALICKELNSKMINPKKIARLNLIINWLKEFKFLPPSLEEKVNFKTKLALELKKYQKN